MARYYVNRTPQLNGDHEVHEDCCLWLARADHKQYLGEFDNCHTAMIEAKKTYRTANGCAYCATACNTS